MQTSNGWCSVPLSITNDPQVKSKSARPGFSLLFDSRNTPRPILFLSIPAPFHWPPFCTHLIRHGLICKLTFGAGHNCQSFFLSCCQIRTGNIPKSGTYFDASVLPGISYNFNPIRAPDWVCGQTDYPALFLEAMSLHKGVRGVQEWPINDAFLCVSTRLFMKIDATGIAIGQTASVPAAV